MTSKPSPPDDDQPVIRPFADFLREHDRGRTHEDLSEALHELVQAVKDTGKAGAVVLTVKVAPLGKDSTDQLKVTSAVTTKKPASEPRPVIFFTDTDGNLTRHDPNQLAFESLKAVDDTPKTPKEIAR